MRVLMLGWFGDCANSGGMEAHIRGICKNIASEELAVALTVPKGFMRIPCAKNLEIIEIPCVTCAKSIEETIKNVSKFNKNIVRAFEARGFAFDIIHSHDWLCIASAKKMSCKYGVPWIHTVHSLEHIRAAEETRSKISEIEKNGILNANKIIAVSALLKNEILKKYKRPPEKIDVIRNYTSMARNEISENEITERKKTVLFVGRLAQQKSVETLIAAFKDVLIAHPDASLVIAGEGNLKKSLMAFARINGIEKSVYFKGYVDEKTLASLYLEASVFVSPSVFEPFGITILDAAEFGAPIIATKDTGALEIFGKESAKIIEPQNPRALAKEIIALLNNNSLRVEMAKRAKEDLKMAENWNAIAERTADVYGRMY